MTKAAILAILADATRRREGNTPREILATFRKLRAEGRYAFLREEDIPTEAEIEAEIRNVAPPSPTA